MTVGVERYNTKIHKGIYASHAPALPWCTTSHNAPPTVRPTACPASFNIILYLSLSSWIYIIVHFQFHFQWRTQPSASYVSYLPNARRRRYFKAREAADSLIRETTEVAATGAINLNEVCD